MKVTEKELREMVKKALKKKLMGEGKDFSARRRVVNAARQASMDFEAEIISILGLVNPDEMPVQLQQKYYLVVKNMEDSVTKAVMLAVKELSGFPKEAEMEKSE